MVVTYENKNGQVYMDGEPVAKALIEGLQCKHGIPKWHCALLVTHPEVIVNDEVEASAGCLDNKFRLDFHIDEQTMEIQSVNIFI